MMSQDDSGAGYRPSPRPDFAGPTLIRYQDAVRHLWGDDESGRVADWIYLSNHALHVIVFSLPVGGGFTHSRAYRTIFGADEVMVVLEGEFALANPETGEVERARPGEAIFFRRGTWHHGFNIGSSQVRVLEFFSPPPATGTSGEYARRQAYLEKTDWRYSPADRPSEIGKGIEKGPRRPTLTRIEERLMALELRGANRKAAVGYYAQTEHLSAGTLTLNPGTRMPAESHAGDELVYIDDGSLFVFVPDSPNQKWFELGPRDGMYLPAAASHEYHNLSGQPVKAMFAQAPSRKAQGPSSSTESA
jgi:quercetin dioxygenase-like cupin family protein